MISSTVAALTRTGIMIVVFEVILIVILLSILAIMLIKMALYKKSNVYKNSVIEYVREKVHIDKIELEKMDQIEKDYKKHLVKKDYQPLIEKLPLANDFDETDFELFPSTPHIDVVLCDKNLAEKSNLEIDFEGFDNFQNLIAKESNLNKAIYNELKNYIVAYKNIRTRINKKAEVFKSLGKNLIRLIVEENKLILQFVLSLDEVEMINGLTETNDNNFSTQIIVNSFESLKNAKKSIDICMKKINATKINNEYKDFARENLIKSAKYFV